MKNDLSIQINGLILFVMMLSILNLSCSSEKAEVRQIRAHLQPIEGVAHPAGLNHAERYCQGCHGSHLIGGSKLEPSCYTCHGKNWADSDATLVHAPASHTLQYGLWFHDPNHNNAGSVCSSCHGPNLEGTSATPSCTLCHEKNW